MKKFYLLLLLICALAFSVSAQVNILETSFEGPNFDVGWTIGMSQSIDTPPEDYPATGLQPWEKWDLTEPQSFGYVHSGDSAAWIGGTAYDTPKHDWLMTPPMEIPEQGETVLYYWLWYHSEMLYVSRFYIMVYDIDDDSWHLAYKLADEFNSPLHYVEEYSLDISEWKGKDIMLAFVKNGTYQLAMDDVRVVNTKPESLEDIANNNVLKVYPNPADDILKIDFENVTGDNTLYITDVTGRLVMSSIIADRYAEIDISGLNRGVYIVNYGTARTKLIVR